jgi:hypothetical protein
VETTHYESMLLPEDLAQEAPLHCLACRRQVGKVTFLAKGKSVRQKLVSLSVDPTLVQGVVGSRSCVRFSCECGKTSLYHLML